MAKRLGPDEYIGANGDPMTRQEAIAIGQLERLAQQWPKTLTLLSMDGILYVIHTGDPRLNEIPGADRAETVLATIRGIPNDGGGW